VRQRPLVGRDLHQPAFDRPVSTGLHYRCGLVPGGEAAQVVAQLVDVVAVVSDLGGEAVAEGRLLVAGQLVGSVRRRHAHRPAKRFADLSPRRHVALCRPDRAHSHTSQAIPRPGRHNYEVGTIGVPRRPPTPAALANAHPP
jgi:hypothetical protein